MRHGWQDSLKNESEEKASSYFTGREWGIELPFVQSCRAHNEQHGVSVRATISGHRAAESAKTVQIGFHLMWVPDI